MGKGEDEEQLFVFSGSDLISSSRDSRIHKLQQDPFIHSRLHRFPSGTFSYFFPRSSELQ